MADEDGQLVVQLEARIRDFEKNFQKASRTANDNWNKIEGRGRQAAARVESDLTKAASSIGSTLKSIAGSFGSSIGITGLGLTAMLATAVQINGELAKIEGMAKRAGLSTDRLQEVKFAANLKGVSNETFSTDIDSSLWLLDEASRQVNDLQKLFNKNGLSIRNQNGDLLKFDELLERAAKLMAGAQTEQQKARIAEMLGLSRDWVRVLEGGPEAFRKSTQEARNAGAVIDSDIIAKAKQFDREWNQAIVKFKAGMIDAMADLARAFGEFWQEVIDDVPGASFIRDTLERWGGGLRGMTIPELREAIAKSIEQGLGQDEVDRLQAELDRRLGKKPLKVTVTPEVTDQPTVIPRERERNAFERATYEANKRIALMGAETLAIGKVSEARERARLVAELEEAAKKANTEAGFQNTQVTEAQRQKINQLADAMFAAAQKQREAQQQFQSWNDTLRFSGSLAVDFFDSLGDKAKSFADIMQSAMAKVKTALLNAVILGQGPLAGILGMASPVQGGTGGLLGALFGGHRASGGPVSDGKAYVVGEHGQEVFVPDTPGRIIPNHAISVPAGSSGMGNTLNVAPTINVSVGGGSRGQQADADLGKQIAKQVENTVRAVATDVLRQQMRSGGMLGR
jgi:hypothetical protein